MGRGANRGVTGFVTLMTDAVDRACLEQRSRAAI